MSLLFTDKFFPQGFDDFIGNPEIVDAVKKWCEDWEQGKQGKPLLFFGSTGTGKTCLALLVAKVFGWELFELNASDFRTKDIVEKLAGTASQSRSFSGKHRLVLLDEIDGLQSQDRGGAGAIVKILRETKNPVILTANSIYADQKLLPVREACQLLHFKKINYLSIARRLKEICSKENISFEEDAIKELAKSCSGDFRAALLDLQSLSFAEKISMQDLESISFREREEDVFKVLEKIFKSSSVKEIGQARNSSEVNNDLLLRWVEENIPRVFKQGNDASIAFDRLSRADVFNGRIMRRQNYVFLKYSSELMTSGVSLSKENEYHGWLQFQFPSLLRKLSASSALRQMKTELGKKIGKKTHSGAREVLVKDLPFLKMLFEGKEYSARLSAEFDLSEKEIAFLLGAKPDSEKAEKVFALAQSLKQGKISSKVSLPAEKAEFSEEEKETHMQTKLF